MQSQGPDSPRPGTLTLWTLLSLAPAKAAASPDTEPSSWLEPCAPPAGSGGGGGGVAPVGGGGTGGGGGGGGPLQERGALAADEGCPGGRVGPEIQEWGSVSCQSPAGAPLGGGTQGSLLPGLPLPGSPCGTRLALVQLVPMLVFLAFWGLAGLTVSHIHHPLSSANLFLSWPFRERESALMPQQCLNLLLCT